MELDWLAGLGGGLMIGTAAALFLLGNGRIAGISGILGAALEGRDLPETLAFLAGLAGAAAIYSLGLGAPEILVTGSAPLLLIGGLMVGVGTRLGAGCTSGHGVCGLSRLSPRSLAATATFMGVAITVVFVTRHVLEGF